MLLSPPAFVPTAGTAELVILFLPSCLHPSPHSSSPLFLRPGHCLQPVDGDAGLTRGPAQEERLQVQAVRGRQYTCGWILCTYIHTPL